MTQSLIDCWNQGDRWALASVLQRGVQGMQSFRTQSIRTSRFGRSRFGRSCFGRCYFGLALRKFRRCIEDFDDISPTFSKKIIAGEKNTRVTKQNRLLWYYVTE